MIVGMFILVILTVLFIVFFERAMRKILINYPKRQVGNKMYGVSHLLTFKNHYSRSNTSHICICVVTFAITISNFGFTESDTF